MNERHAFRSTWLYENPNQPIPDYPVKAQWFVENLTTGECFTKQTVYEFVAGQYVANTTAVFEGPLADRADAQIRAGLAGGVTQVTVPWTCCDCGESADDCECCTVCDHPCDCNAGSDDGDRDACQCPSPAWDWTMLVLAMLILDPTRHDHEGHDDRCSMCSWSRADHEDDNLGDVDNEQDHTR